MRPRQRDSLARIAALVARQVGHRDSLGVSVRLLAGIGQERLLATFTELLLERPVGFVTCQVPYASNSAKTVVRPR